MKLHWSPKSPYVRKVMICLEELGLEGRVECVRTVAAMLTPNARLMADNPLSKIPTLILDDGRTLFDSAVICEYFDTEAEGHLFPRSGAARWQALRWHALGDGLLDALILWRNERERERPLKGLVAAFEQKTVAVLALLEAEVDDLEAEPVAIGHVAIGCALGYLDYRFDGFGWRARAPRLASWEARLSQRPSWQRTAPVDG
jgi:glutathione S-transferase